MNEFFKSLLAGAASGAARSGAVAFKEALGLTDDELRTLVQAAAGELADLETLVTGADLESAYVAATSPRLRGDARRAALIKLAGLAIKSAREIKT